MGAKIIIALDAMGGDHAPGCVIAGADLAIRKLIETGLDIKYEIYALESSLYTIESLLSAFPLVKANSEVFATTEAVLSEDKPATAVRKRKNSSMYRAISSLKAAQAHCVVSAGNTGALMAIAKILLGTLPNILRPAIITTIPTKRGELVVLDLGANLECSSEVLFQFAYMGSAFAKIVFNRESPRVALLNIGTEENKGTDSIKEAWHLLNKHNNKAFKTTKSGLNFVGYAEPEQMLSGNIDVIVTDGFNGNIMLKTAESIYYLVKQAISDSFNQSLLGYFLGMLTKQKLKEALKTFDPKLRNGAMLIGLNGVVIKAHGSSDTIAFASAIEVAANAVHYDINAQIVRNIENIDIEMDIDLAIENIEYRESLAEKNLILNSLK